MSVRMYEKDYSRLDERRFFSMNESFEKLEELTYSEMRLEMHKDLEEMVENEFIEQSIAFELEGDIVAYNEYAEEFYHFMKGN
ncbi:hypothetical protein [Streptococcus cuniculi]|uniref:Uncharacterized protein n=1 Tax=Streptococcus cuniculi TaxID=1432788 RepID=A0A4Y9JC65_9STRE|nr:hypothetical protein [Streptococcus cuniculi]MBF0777873.1 hypothetical protein [Streptococcus cuniculi]TFU98171.1 hypothetical protein E4T82_03940 [Streptococcus cuniculi]